MAAYRRRRGCGRSARKHSNKPWLQTTAKKQKARYENVPGTGYENVPKAGYENVPSIPKGRELPGTKTYLLSRYPSQEEVTPPTPTTGKLGPKRHAVLAV